MCIASRTEFGLGDPGDPDSNLDSMTSQLGDSGMRPAPQVPYQQNGSPNPCPPKAAFPGLSLRGWKKTWDGGAISK